MTRRRWAAILVVAALAAMAVLLNPCGSARDAPDRTATSGGIEAGAAVGTEKPVAARHRVAPSAQAPEAPPAEKPAAALHASLVVRVVAAEAKTPLAGANAVIEDANDAQHRAATDAAGTARLAEVVPGRTLVWAQAEGRLRSGYTEIGAPAGAEASVEIALERGVVLEGVVLDARDGLPIEGAGVDVEEGGNLDYESSGVWAPPLGHSTTGPEGRFRVRVPVDTIVTAKVTARGFVERARSARLPAGDAPRPPIEIRLEAAGTLRGTVRDPDGQAVAGATVYVVPADQPNLVASPDTEYSDGTRALRATTDETGRYERDGLSRGGSYVAFALARGWGRSLPRTGVLVTDAAPAASADFALRRLGTIVVRVLGVDGNPMPAADVHWWSAMPYQATSRNADEHGVLRIGEAEPTHYVLAAKMPGLPAATAEVDLAEGATLETTLRFGPGVAISGVVVDDAGKPVGDAEMQVRRPWGEAGAAMPPSEATSKSGADGLFRIEGLRTGAHIVTVLTSTHVFLNDQPVVAPAQDLRFVLHRRGSVKLRVVVPPGLPPPSSFQIYGETFWETRSDGVELWSGSIIGIEEFGDGRFTVSGVKPGTCRARVLSREFGTLVTRSFELAPGATVDLGDVALDPGIQLTGRVEDAAGAPVAGAHVTTGDSSFSPNFRHATTAPDGGFRLPHIPLGRNEFLVKAPGFVTSTIHADVVSGGAPLVMRLSRGTTLHVTVVDADGGPLPGVTVHIQPVGSPDEDAEYCNADNRGVVEQRVAPGRHTVTVLGRGPLTATQTYRDVPRGPSVDVDATEGGEIALRLVVE